MRGAVRRAPRELGYRGVQVLDMIRERIETHGCAPTSHQIMTELGFYDRAGVVRVVERLEKRGLISRAGRGRVRQFVRLMVNNN